MLSEKLLPPLPGIARKRSTQSTTSNREPLSLPQEPPPTYDTASPTVTQGLYIIVDAADEFDQGLYPVTPHSTVQSPQAEKIPCMTSYTTAQLDEAGNTTWLSYGSRPPSGYFIRKVQIRRCLVFSTIVVVIVVIATCIGVALGVTATNANRLLMSPQQQTDGGSPTQQAPGLPVDTIYNDTSITAFESEDQQRHVFYQAINGSIQHATYSNEWSTEDLGLVDARDHTPLSAVSGPKGITYLFYITNESLLTSAQLKSGSWQPYPLSIPLQLSAQTRQLAASWVPSYNGDNSEFQALVMTQRPGDGISMIHVSTNSTQSSFNQNDTTADLNRSNPKFSFNAPCAVVANTSSGDTPALPFLSHGHTYPWIAIFSNEYGNPATNIIGTGYDGKQLISNAYGLHFNASITNSSTVLPTRIPSISYDLTVALISEQLSILYVDNGMLVSSEDTNSNPRSVRNDNSTYPYTRLGGFLSNSNLYYLYHQLDESTIAEAVFDLNSNWTTSNLTLST